MNRIINKMDTIAVICGRVMYGNFFKGPKLTKISPKKTYTGVIGGFLISLIVGLVYIKYLAKSNKCVTFFFSILFIMARRTARRTLRGGKRRKSKTHKKRRKSRKSHKKRSKTRRRRRR